MKIDSYEERFRPWDILAASGIALLAALMLFMVMHHPVAKHDDAGGMLASMARQASMDGWVHGTLIAVMTVMTCLMLGFAARLGLYRTHVLLGAVASGLALVLVCAAMVLDGFVAPALARLCLESGGDCAQTTLLSLRYGGLQIEFLTRIGFVALAGATAMWAVDLVLRRDRAIPFGMVGLLSAIVQLGLVVGSREQLGPHKLALIVAAQAIWYLSVALMIALGRGPYAVDAAV